MASVPVLARSNSLLPAPSAVGGQAGSPDTSTKLQEALDKLFPDLLVHGTRNALLSMTTSLTKVSGHAHQYFARVSQVLAFERMMRSFAGLAAAMSPFPMDLIAGNFWNGLFPSGRQIPSPWPYPAAQSQQPPLAMMPFLPNAFQARPANPNPMQAWDYSPLFIVPMALLIAAPVTETWWNFSL
jgi:hypothetical protein